MTAPDNTDGSGAHESAVSSDGPGRVDVLVVGGGTAGLSAALVLGRSRRTVHLIDAGRPRNATAAHIHGTVTRDGTPPGEFYATARAELARYDVTLTDATVERLEPDPQHEPDGTGDPQDGWVARLDDGRRVRGRRLVVATGLVDRLPEVPGVAELWGRDVVSCPYCHGWEVADTPLALLVTRPGDLSRALLLTQWSPRVRVLLHHLDRDQLDPDLRATAESAGVDIVDGPVTRLDLDRGRLRRVVTASGQRFAHPVLFVVPDLIPRSGLLTDLGAATDPNGWPTVDPTGATSLPGVWAIGNTADSSHKVIHAAASGVTTAQAVNEDLLDADLTPLIRRRATSRAASIP